MDKELGKAPSIEQLASRLGMKPGKVERLFRAVSTPLSIAELDAEWASIGVMEPSPRRHLFDKELAQAAEGSLDTLDAREAKVLRLRFGFGAEAHTLEEIGQLMGVTRERIRQIEAKGLRKLKHPSRSDPLRHLIDLADRPPKEFHPHKGQPTEFEDALDELSSEDSEPPDPNAARRTYTPVADHSALEKLLGELISQGIAVEESGAGQTRATWVLLRDDHGKRARRHASSLIAMGFKEWPGVGFWK